MISGTTELIAHIGFPTHTFKSPAIYNAYFEKVGVDAVLVGETLMRAPDIEAACRELTAL